MKDSGVKSLYYNKNKNSKTTSSIKRHDYSTLKKENVSEILLKQSKSTQNIYIPSDKNKLNFSGSTKIINKILIYLKIKKLIQ